MLKILNKFRPRPTPTHHWDQKSEQGNEGYRFRQDMIKYHAHTLLNNLKHDWSISMTNQKNFFECSCHCNLQYLPLISYPLSELVKYDLPFVWLIPVYNHVLTRSVIPAYTNIPQASMYECCRTIYPRIGASTILDTVSAFGIVNITSFFCK